MKRSLSGIVAMGLMFILGSCEKESSSTYLPERPHVGIDENNPPYAYDYQQFSTEAKLRDSVYFYTYYFYLWQDKLPGSFATFNYRTADALLEQLKTYALGPDGKPYDRYSFLDRSGTISQEIQQGRMGSLGFEVRYQTEQDLYIKKVDLGSPAYQAGLRRGWQLTSINGRTDLSLAAMEQDDFLFLFNAIYGQSVNISAKDPLGQTHQFALQSNVYNLQPILARTVIDQGGQKVGYFAFDSFISLQQIRSQLDMAFADFAAAGVRDLIVDLRYNGGGDVKTANYLSNLMAPSSANNSLMNRYIINGLLKFEGWDLFLFGPEFYSKQNALEPENLYFLVTNGTASASELLINNLIPHTNVHIIGDSRTYGKPVGYFGWDIMGAELYAVSFQTLNSLGQGHYFDGMPYDKWAKDDLTKDFGDPTEAMTAEALFHSQYGTYSPETLSLSMSTRGKSSPLSAASRIDINKDLDNKKFKGMFDFRKITLPAAETKIVN